MGAVPPFTATAVKVILAPAHIVFPGLAAVLTEGVTLAETVMAMLLQLPTLLPVPTIVPPQLPLYHCHCVALFRLPVLILSVELAPAHKLVCDAANTGTSPMLSLRAAMMLACSQFRLTPEEALAGTTRIAAKALGLAADTGTLEPGKAADLAVWDIERPAELSYWLGPIDLDHGAWRARSASGHGAFHPTRPRPLIRIPLVSDKTVEQIAHNRRASRLRLVRQLHFWVAVFVAPSLMLFALTGMLQLFKLHEAEGGYRPLPVIEKLGQVHIHQTYALRPVRARPPEPAAPDGAQGVGLVD
eukprot:gene28889-38206_t